MKPRIVIVEDERDLLELLEYHLAKEYEVEGFLDTKMVQQFLEEEGADLLLLDRNLPGQEGSEFVQRLRKEGIDTPVIFLTAKGSEEQIEEGFVRGADDYITKPFNIKELIFRIKAVLRRTNPKTQEVVRYRDIEIHPVSQEVYVEGRLVHLSQLEYRLLMELVTNHHQVLSRDYLLDRVWGDSTQERSVNVAIKRLKDKIDPDKSKNYIESIRGVGYKFC